MALVHVLVHVLDGADAAADFDVDVAVVLEEQGGIVGHHPLVGELDGVTTCAVGMGSGGSATVVGAGVDGVGVVAGLRLCLKRLGKSFGAGLGLPVHARRVGVVASATGPVEHVLGDGRVKTWLGLGIGELGRDDGVYVGRRAGFVLRSEVDEYVCVWEAPFLELDDKEIGHDLAQNLSLLQVLHESFPLQVEHARAKVRPVGGLLMGKQVAPDTVCASCTACSATEYQTTACSGTQNRVCASCTQQTVTNCGAYSATCFNGLNQQTCKACAYGYYLDGTSNVCSIANPIGPSSTPPPQNFYNTSGQTIATVTFTSVTTGGFTTVVPLTSTSIGFIPLPANFALGNPAVYYDISTTAVYSAPITICLQYYSNSAGTPHMLHYTAGSWFDVTTSVNPTTFTVCGQVNSFSNFVVAFGLSATATGDPHLVSASGVGYDFDGEPGNTYSLFSAPQFQVAMHLAGDGPGTHFMTEIGLLFKGEEFLFGVTTMGEDSVPTWRPGSRASGAPSWSGTRGLPGSPCARDTR